MTSELIMTVRCDIVESGIIVVTGLQNLRKLNINQMNRKNRIIK